jgi:hypothetical protein
MGCRRLGLDPPRESREREDLARPFRLDLPIGPHGVGRQRHVLLLRDRADHLQSTGSRVGRAIRAGLVPALLRLGLYGRRHRARLQRDAGSPAHDRFESLHRRSVQLNGVVLVLGLGLLIAFATRPSPRTEGIVESPPAERARQAEERFLRSREGEPTPPASGTLTPSRPSRTTTDRGQPGRR